MKTRFIVISILIQLVCRLAYTQNIVNVRYQVCTGCGHGNQWHTDAGPTANYTYGAPTYYVSSEVGSDFGPRMLGQDYDWHGGVDLSHAPGDDDKGDLILPVETGSIERLRGGGYYKYMVVDGAHNFGYGHMFSSALVTGIGAGEYQRNGNVVLKKRSDNDNEYAIIFIAETPIRAIGLGGTVIWDSTTYDVDNIVHNVDTAISIVGDSYGTNNPGNVDAHLHLYNFADGHINTSDNYAKNPLQFLTYAQPVYDPETEVTIGYDETPTKFKVRMQMSGQAGGGGYDVVQNVNSVGLRLRPESSQNHPELIQGNRYWGYISLGGAISGTPQSQYYPDHVNVSDNGNVGTWARTGVAPMAYNTQAWDDYYFCDFYSRIHKKHGVGSSLLLANIPSRAKYSDGAYIFNPSATEISNPSIGGTSNYHLYTGPNSAEEIEIDNFYPYIERTFVFVSGGKKVYQGDYESPGCEPDVADCALVSFAESSIEQSELPSSGVVVITIKASEPLENAGLNGLLQDPNGVIFGTSDIRSLDEDKGRFWLFKYVDVPFISGGEYSYKIFGQDLSDNGLLNFDLLGEVAAPNTETIPHRASAGQWEPVIPQNASGYSKVYKFTLKGACAQSNGNLTDKPIGLKAGLSTNPTCDCAPAADFTYAQQTSSLTLDFDAGLSAGTEPLQYVWDYGDGSSGSGKLSAHTYAEGGDYLVKLTVTDPCDGSAAAEKWITVMEAGGSLLEVDIEGPTVALKNQEVAFHALAGGGVPPYTFCWSAGGGDPQPLPGPAYQCGPYEENQTIAFHQPTGLGTATVSVVVTDAAGQQADDLLYIDIREADLDLDFNHFPATPTGLSANDALAVGQYLAWAAVVTPLSEWELPLEYTWNFGDGTVVTEPDGQTEHSFMDDNVYTVSLKMCNPVYGTCLTKTKTFYVGNPPPPPPGGYKITPEQTVELTWGGATKTIALTKTNGAFCAPNSNSGCGPTIAWASVGWPDCGYTAQTSSSIVGPSFQINVDGSDPCVSSWEFADPTTIHPWGCLEVAAQDANCGGAYHPCAVYLRPAALQAQNLRIEEEAGCQFRLAADVSGGGWKNGAEPTAPYREYRWEIFDFEDSKTPIEGLLDDPAAKSPSLQLQHPYIEQTPVRQHVLFVAKLTVVDWANQTAEAYQVLSFNPFRLLVEEAYQRCPERRSYFTDDALASGGTGIYEYSWSVLQPAGSALDFESGDAHDPFPFFQAPASGSKVYRLNVKMKDASGAVLCERERDITVAASALALTLPAAASACAGQGATVIGPADASDLGGSGRYGFEWTTTNPGDLAYLSDKFAANPVVQGVPAGQTIVYELLAGDINSFGCTTTATIAITGYPNDVAVDFGEDITTCFGEEINLSALTAPTPPPWPNPLQSYLKYEWTTTHPHPEMLAPSPIWAAATISEQMANYAGTHVFTLKATHKTTGCVASDAVNVTVRPQWKHAGYAPELRSAVVGSAVPLWTGNNNTITAGVDLNDLEIGWQPAPPVSVLKNGDLPYNGTFIPTPAAPYLTMTVADNTSDCARTYKTIRYLLSDSAPELSITADNAAICLGAENCFEVVFDAHLANSQTALLPAEVAVTCRLYLPFVQPPSAPREINLRLQNNSGLYKGRFCESAYFQNEAWLNNPYEVVVSLGSAAESIWANIPSVQCPVYIVEQQAFPLNHLVQCRPADDFATTKALQVEYGVTPCANGLVSDDAGVTMARDYIEFHPEAGIEIVPITAPGNNKGRLFLINPCLTPATQAAAPNENTPAAIGAVIAEKKASIPDQRMGAIAMQVFPNPFSHEIEIRYTLNTLEPTVINLQILDFFGKAIQTIESETERQPGSYSARFNGSALGSGIYMIRLTAGNAEWVTQKIIKIND